MTLLQEILKEEKSENWSFHKDGSLVYATGNIADLIEIKIPKSGEYKGKLIGIIKNKLHDTKKNDLQSLNKLTSKAKQSLPTDLRDKFVKYHNFK